MFEPHKYSETELQVLAEAYAGNDAEIVRLLPTVRAAVAEYGPVVGMAATAKALRDSGWDRDDLVLLLAVALVRSMGAKGADR